MRYLRVITALYKGRTSHGGSGLDDQDPGILRIIFDELSSLELGNIDMAGFR